MKPLNHVYIYGLVDIEEGVIRYIGKTKEIEKRYSTHINNNHPADKNTSLGKWISYLKQNNKKPFIVILDCVHEQHGSELEIAWIKHFTQLGAKLFNKKVKIYEKKRNSIS